MVAWRKRAKFEAWLRAELDEPHYPSCDAELAEHGERDLRGPGRGGWFCCFYREQLLRPGFGPRLARYMYVSRQRHERQDRRHEKSRAKRQKFAGAWDTLRARRRYRLIHRRKW